MRIDSVMNVWLICGRNRFARMRPMLAAHQPPHARFASNASSNLLNYQIAAAVRSAVRSADNPVAEITEELPREQLELVSPGASRWGLDLLEIQSGHSIEPLRCSNN